MLGEGIHPDVPMKQYVEDPCEAPSLSKGTMLTLLTLSAAHARLGHPRLNPAWEHDDSSRAEIGTAIHSQILGGGDLVYAPEAWEDWRKKDAQAFRDQTREAGKTPLLQRQRSEIEGAAEAGKRRLADIAHGPVRYEQTIIWKDGPTWKRGRPDVLTGDTCIDVKTCESVSPAQWIRTSLPSGGYDIQEAHYLEGLRKLGVLSPRGQFLFLLVEIVPPFSTVLVDLSPEYHDLAVRKCHSATKLWERCMATGEWPGYDQRVHTAEVPPWLQVGQLEREAEDRSAEEAAGGAVVQAMKESKE